MVRLGGGEQPRFFLGATLAQFYGGLEETPYDGWTLSGLVACGPRLLLTCPVDGLATTTGWTAATGSLPTVEANRFKWAGTAYVLTCTVSTSGGATLSQRGGIAMTA